LAVVPRRWPRLPAGFGGRSERTVARILITPGQLLLAFIVAFPAAVAIYISFTNFDPTSGYLWYSAYKSWLWFANFWEALSGSDFWDAVWRTALVTSLGVGVELLLGFSLALLFLRNFRGRSLLTVVFLLPMMVVPAVTGFIFFMLLQSDGPVNGILTFFLKDLLHLTGPISIGWLSDPNIAIFSVTITDIWQWTPLMFLILLSGLVALPEDQLNAARILGAGFWQQLRYLILPMMWPIILIAVIIRAMETFKIFDTPWLLTQGGPGTSTTTLSVYLYRVTQIATRWGYGSAVALLVLIMVSAVAMRAIRPIEAAQEEEVAVAPRGEAAAIEKVIEAESVI
jgi:multiple sugar transport system permease protein